MGGAQTYETSKHTRVHPNIGGIQTYRGTSKHANIQGASKHTGGCPNIWEHLNIQGDPNIGGIQTYGGIQT